MFQKGYKTISKVLGLHQFKQEIYDHCYLCPGVDDTPDKVIRRARHVGMGQGLKGNQGDSKATKDLSHWPTLIFMSPPSGKHYTAY